MSTVMIAKEEYLDLKRKQEQIASKLAFLQAALVELVRDEVKPSIVKRLERQSGLIDCGKAKSFPAFKSFQKYLREL